jgi:hypothetical protein
MSDGMLSRRVMTENACSIELAGKVRDNENRMNTLPINILEVIGKIQQLAEYRERYIGEIHKPPPFRDAAEMLGVSADEVHSYAPELYMQWYDSGFHCHLPKEHPFH